MDRLFLPWVRLLDGQLRRGRQSFRLLIRLFIGCQPYQLFLETHSATHGLWGECSATGCVVFWPFCD